MTGTRSYEFARRWVAKGHKVTMLTSTANLTSEDLAQAHGRFFKKFTVDGIDVMAMAVPYRQQMSVFKRGLSFLAFLLLSSGVVLFTRKPDIVYATSTPLTVGVPCLFGKWLRKIPFVFEVRDQWPEIPIELGIIKNKVFIKFLLWLEKTIYKNSSAIIAGSPGQADGIKNVYSSKRSIVIPNSCDIDTFTPAIDGSEIRQKYGWQNKLVFLHAGAMGKVNGLEFVVDVAKNLRNLPDIRFVLLGDGNQKQRLEEKIKSLNLNNIEILPSVSKKDIPVFFAAANVGLVIIGNYPIIEHNSANKFFDSLSAGKPVLLNYSGWQRELLETAEAGLGCKLCDVDEFTEKVMYFRDNRGKLAEMGRNSRRLAEEKFDRNKLAQQALDVVSDTTRQN